MKEIDKKIVEKAKLMVNKTKKMDLIGSTEIKEDWGATTREELVIIFAQSVAKMHLNADDYYYHEKDVDMCDFINVQISALQNELGRIGIWDEVVEKAKELYDFSNSGRGDYILTDEYEMVEDRERFLDFMCSLKEVQDKKLAIKAQYNNVTFSEALELVKKGYKIFREGWNGKNQFVVYQKGYPQGINCNKQTAEAWGMNEGDLFKCSPYLQIQTVDGSHAMWVPSITDLLANDWRVK